VCAKSCRWGVFTNTHQYEFVLAGQVSKPTAIMLCTGDVHGDGIQGFGDLSDFLFHDGQGSCWEGMGQAMLNQFGNVNDT